MSQGGQVTAEFAVSSEMATGGCSGIGSGSAGQPVTKLVMMPLSDSAKGAASYGVGATGGCDETIAGQVEQESSTELQLPSSKFQLGCRCLEASSNNLDSLFLSIFPMSTNALRSDLMSYLLSYHGSLNDDLPHAMSASNLKVHIDAIKDLSNTSALQMKRSSPNTPSKLYPESACQSKPMVGQTIPNIFSASANGPLMNYMDGGHVDINETMDNGLEELKMVLQKELTNSDVGRIGRIVLPKKEAESNLPPLSERDGMMLQMDDLILPTTWKFKYRFWPNNRSRMYIMEATGDFVRTHGLQTGDFFIIYKNFTSGSYVVASKKCNRLPTSVDLLHCHSMKQCNMNEDGNSLLSRIGKVRGAKHQLCLKPSTSLGQHSHPFVTVARNDSLRTGVLNDFDQNPVGPHYQSLPP